MPEWLPEKAPVNPWRENTYDMLYELFCRDIRDHDLRYQGKHVWFFPDMEEGREKIFWHLTSRQAKPKTIPRRKRKFYCQNRLIPELERLPDLHRCERLPWVRPMIEHSTEPEVLAWNYEEGDRSIKTYVWLKGFDFVVIMKKYADQKRRLITSFYVDRDYKQDDFKKKYANRIKYERPARTAGPSPSALTPLRDGG